MMSPNPREPVVLIPGSPDDRVDPELGQRVRDAVKRSNTGGYRAAVGRKAPASDPASRDSRPSTPTL